MKDYYRHLKDARLKKYFTEPYPSLATGNLCVTFARASEDRITPARAVR
jgi:hypothetical protein